MPKNLQSVIVSTEDGAIIQVFQGETHYSPNDELLTYETLMRYICDGTLKEHGLFPCNLKMLNSNNSKSRSSAIENSMLLAAII